MNLLIIIRIATEALVYTVTIRMTALKLSSSGIKNPDFMTRSLCPGLEGRC